MSRGLQTFKQGDVTKAIKAALRAGLHVDKVEIAEGGKIVVHVAAEAGDQGKAKSDEWD